MPCDSRIPIRLTTKMNGMQAVHDAAKAIGLFVRPYGTNMIYVSDGYDGITLSADGDQIIAEESDGGEKAMKRIVANIGKSYAEIRLRQFAKARGYTVSAGVTKDTFELNRQKQYGQVSYVKTYGGK